MRSLSKRVDSEWDSVKADLQTIRAALLSRWVYVPVCVSVVCVCVCVCVLCVCVYVCE